MLGGTRVWERAVGRWLVMDSRDTGGNWFGTERNTVLESISREKLIGKADRKSPGKTFVLLNSVSRVTPSLLFISCRRHWFWWCPPSLCDLFTHSPPPPALLGFS